MSIENNLASIAKSLETIAAHLQKCVTVSPSLPLESSGVSPAASIPPELVTAPTTPAAPSVATPLPIPAPGTPVPGTAGFAMPMPIVEIPPAPPVSMTAPAATVPAPAVPLGIPTAPNPGPTVTPSGIMLPFNDGQTLLGYVMNKYRVLGPVKGATIQNILNELGVKNVNQVSPTQYEQFYMKVEAIQ